MSSADLLKYVLGELDWDISDHAYAETCWDEASSLVKRFAGAELDETEAGVIPAGAAVPAVALRRAVLEVAAELYNRKDTKNGISQFASPDGGSGIRIARDPMVAAYPILAPFVGRGISIGGAPSFDGGTP